MQKIAVTGAGFAGLSAACCLAQKGFEVTIFEKNNTIGGRARQYQSSGFNFDMGPSWYWMPDVFEAFVQRFGHEVEDFFELKKLDPGFVINFGKGESLSIPAGLPAIYQVFEKLEPGSAEKLRSFLKEAAYKYEVGMRDLVYQPGLSLSEFFDLRLLKSLFRMGVFQSFSKYVRKYFRHPQLIQLMEFPMLFLGAMPQDTPALYSLMNYAALAQGTWYPMGGMYNMVDAMAKIATELGVEIKTSAEVEQIVVEGNKAKGLQTKKGFFPASFVVGAADYHHVEQHLLKAPHRQYTERYWNTRVMAPSALIFYLGVNKKLNNLQHHNLFFDADFQAHARAIYKTPSYPDRPLFYLCCSTKTDPSVAPEGMENLFLLVPLAPGLEDTPELRRACFDQVMERLETHCGEPVRSSIIFNRNYSLTDFQQDYHAYKGNAYGLANTLFQTAIFKPKMRSPKVKNLFYAGQLTTPGPGVPPSIISGQVVASLIAKESSKVK
ncbi:MAG: phytoene desaturase [Saprospiraceae bacterium]|nr:MAG: phytoene desaturase [Saprospiraceae bacterium]